MRQCLIETVQVDEEEFEIYEVESLRTTKFVIYRDGRRWLGDCVSLSEARKVAESVRK